MAHGPLLHEWCPMFRLQIVLWESTFKADGRASFTIEQWLPQPPITELGNPGSLASSVEFSSNFVLCVSAVARMSEVLTF